MIYLVATIVLTSYLTLSFKMLERFRISNLQAIVFNYLAAVLTGLFWGGTFLSPTSIISQPWFLWACVMGFMFITLFNLIALTAQKLGVAVASVAIKLSLVIPFTFSIYLYNEASGLLKFLGIVLALLAVLLTCWPNRQNKSGDSTSLATRILMPAILFIGSGLLDTMIKYVEHHFIDAANNDAYLVTAFFMAFICGGLFMLIKIGKGDMRFDKRSIPAGFLIGIPNYFSIWFLMQVLKQYPGNSSAIIPIVNMGIVLFSSVMAWVIYREILSVKNWLGIVLSLVAIALIAYG